MHATWFSTREFSLNETLNMQFNHREGSRGLVQTSCRLTEPGYRQDDCQVSQDIGCHNDVIKWKHFPRNWPFVRGIHRSPVNSPHKSQWRGALKFSLIPDWVNNREAGDLRRHRGQYDVIVMWDNSKEGRMRYDFRITKYNTHLAGQQGDPNAHST